MNGTAQGQSHPPAPDPELATHKVGVGPSPSSQATHACKQTIFPLCSYPDSLSRENEQARITLFFHIPSNMHINI